MEIASLIASVVSICLGLLAIWLSWQFYTKGKDAEGRTENALVEIRTQTRLLERLNARTLDRWTQFATGARPADQVTLLLVELMRGMPQSFAQQLRSPADDANNQVQRDAVLRSFIVTYFYAALTNVMAQFHVPAEPSADPNDLIRRLVDGSHGDVLQLESLIASFGREMLQAHPLNSLYEEALQVWRPHVKTLAEVYASRQEVAA